MCDDSCLAGALVSIGWRQASTQPMCFSLHRAMAPLFVGLTCRRVDRFLRRIHMMTQCMAHETSHSSEPSGQGRQGFAGVGKVPQLLEPPLSSALCVAESRSCLVTSLLPGSKHVLQQGPATPVCAGVCMKRHTQLVPPTEMSVIANYDIQCAELDNCLLRYGNYQAAGEADCRYGGRG